MRTQLRAICSVCGREQAVSGTIVAKHGYDVRFGFFNGVCHGAGRPHFGTKEGRDFRAEVATSLANTALSIRQNAEDIVAGRAKPRVVDRNNAPIADPMPWQVDQHVRSLESQASSMLRHAGDMARSVEQWIERFPREVQIEEKTPPMHLLGKRYGYGKACAASAMGARKGAVTSNRADVTCAKCLSLMDKGRA